MIRMHDLDFAMTTTQTESILLSSPSYELKNIGLKHLACNYRPVSLTSTIVKVMESIIKTNILEHLISNNLLTSH